MRTEDTSAHPAPGVDPEPPERRPTESGVEAPLEGRQPTETWGGFGGPEAPSLPEGAELSLGQESVLTVLRELGRGGMGTVYLVQDRRLGREAALKVVRDPTPDRVQRFRREAEITARLSHPAIPPVYDAGQTRDGRDYLLLRYVSGSSLAQRFDRYHERRTRRTRSGRDMPLPRDLLEVLIKVAEALAYAHSRGILHRDLKPQNVLLGPFGETVLLDWGLALDLAEGQENAEMAGTVGYMAPEQARREAVDPRADVFGLGALLTEALTGRLPVEGERVGEVLERLRAGQIRTPAALGVEVAPELEAIAAKALAPAPAQRYAEASAFAEDLRAFLEGRPVSVYRESVTRRGRRWVRQHPTLVVACVLALVGALLILRAREWEREALVREARDGVRLTRRQNLMQPGDPLSQAWTLLAASRRWYDLAPDDPDARGALHHAALRLGDLALASGQWSLARRSYVEGVGLGVDDRLLSLRLDEVATSEATEVEYRRERVQAALELVEESEVPPAAAVDELVFHGSTRTGLQLLVRALEEAAQDLGWCEVRLLVHDLRDPSQVLLNEALLEQRESKPGELLLAEHQQILETSRAEALRRARAEGAEVGSYWDLLLLSQRRHDAAALRRGAALVDALRRLVRQDSARAALFHYGRAVADEGEALRVAGLLIQLGARRAALGTVLRFGEDSPVVQEVRVRAGAVGE
ncbi:MAG: serine/threonine-protein kinase [Planctomycetota bacterium]